MNKKKNVKQTSDLQERNATTERCETVEPFGLITRLVTHMHTPQACRCPKHQCWSRSMPLGTPQGPSSRSSVPCTCTRFHATQVQFSSVQFDLDITNSNHRKEYNQQQSALPFASSAVTYNPWPPNAKIAVVADAIAGRKSTSPIKSVSGFLCENHESRR